MNNQDLSQFLAALSNNGIRFYAHGDIPEGETPSVEFARKFYKPHSHTQLEMICLLQGVLALNINGVWRTGIPELAQVFIPGALHGEHYLTPDTPYRLLWATVFPEALFFHVTGYDPLTGYSTSRKRMAIAPPMCNHLWHTARAPAFTNDSRLHAKFHYLLMECICFFLAEETEKNPPAADYHEQVIEQVKNYISEYYWEDISLAKMAGIVRYSPGHLNAVFRRSEKMPLHRYIIEIRLLKAHQLLQGGEMLAKQAAQAVGFHDPLYFSRVFNKRFGMRPAAFLAATRKRRKGRERQNGTDHMFPRTPLRKHQYS